MAEAKASASPGSVLPWDSEFFGFRIGRLESRRLTASTLHTALTWAVAERLRCAYFFADATCPETLSHAHEGGFRFVDLRMELAVTLNGTAPHATAAEFRPATAVDLPVIESLSRIAHHDTRFFKDTGFPANQAAELYVEWIRRDFRVNRIFVVSDRVNGIGGYVTCQADEDPTVGRIGLIAVAETERRRGLGRELVNGALQWFQHNGCTEVRVVTQASNIPAQRVYQALGFRTSETSATFHRWFKTS
jgi:dTDP-4-amino-4,6-dideoxy-D-galactose acyltransferase